jgi:hypothetical protein
MFDLSEYIDFNGNSCQIYVLIDPRDHIVHYVGRCANPFFRYYQHLHVSPSRRVRRWINELQLLGLTPTKNLVFMWILFGNGFARSNFAPSSWAEEGDIASGDPI